MSLARITRGLAYVIASAATTARHSFRTDRPPQTYVYAFEQRLRERGYTSGKNILREIS